MSSPRSKRVRTTKGSSKCDAKDSEGVSNVTTTRKSKSSYVRWTESEDLRLACLHKIHGNRWNEIVKYFPGRTSKSVKIRFYGTLTRNKTRVNKRRDLAQQFIHLSAPTHTMPHDKYIRRYVDGKFVDQAVHSMLPSFKAPSQQGSALSALLYASQKQRQIDSKNNNNNNTHKRQRSVVDSNSRNANSHSNGISKRARVVVPPLESDEEDPGK